MMQNNGVGVPLDVQAAYAIPALQVPRPNLLFNVI